MSPALLGSAFVRLRVASLALALALALPLPLLLSRALAADVPGPCYLTRLDGESIRAFSTRRITCAVERFGPIPGGVERAVCIADRESHLHPKATSETGMYLGLYQHAAGYWPARYERMTNPDWELPESALNGRSNSIVTVRMVVRAGAWGPAGWPRGDC